MTPPLDFLDELANDLANGCAPDGSTFTASCDRGAPGVHVVAVVDVRLERGSGLLMLRLRKRLRHAGLEPDDRPRLSLGRYESGGHPLTCDPGGLHGAWALGVRRPADEPERDADRLIRSVLREVGLDPCPR